MANKYYAIKKGKKTGIFGSWDECKSYVTGISNAQYKSFKTYYEAKAYLNNTTVSLKNNILIEIPEDSPDCLIAYVDGSYNDTKKLYSYGVVLLTSPPQTYSKADNKSKLVEYRNVAGEILGAITAINYGKKHGYKQIIIYHDYEGIAKWPLREWKAKNAFTQEYVKYYDQAIQKLNIQFKKVAAHTGDTYNELADSLAKEAISLHKNIPYIEENDNVSSFIDNKTISLNLHKTKINSGKIGMININFPYMENYIEMTTIHEVFKNKCKNKKITLKSIESLSVVLNPNCDGITYYITDSKNTSLTINIDFREVLENE